MPKPMQIGSGVCPRSQATLSTISGGSAVRSPVMPVTDT